jgi:exopolysaccharide biosynthesis polyprenyl glycosylphosphotransferase
MIRRFSTNFAIFSGIFDGAVILASLVATVQIRPLLDGRFIRPMDIVPPLPLLIYIFFPLFWVAVLAMFSVYDGQKNLRIVDEFTSLTLASVLAVIMLAGVLYFTVRDVSRALFILFAISSYLLLLLWRIPARLLYWARNRTVSYRTQRILVLGAGPVGREIRSRVDLHRHLNAHFAGFLDDDPEKRDVEPLILGTLDDVRAVIKSQKVTDAVVALPSRAYERINGVVMELEDVPVRVWVVPDYFQFFLRQARMEDFLNIPMLNLRAPALTESERLMKRAFDLLVCLVIFIPFMLIMLVSALLIWLDDGRPILFRQKRVGENGRLFTMYKFRTMVKNAEQMRSVVEQVDEDGNLIHKHPDDPRVTRVGRLLRRLSIDEFPQLFNVMRGTMSLVGPRPELPYLVEKYQSWQRKRFAVPQGVTGWWQIHGRSDKPMHLHTEDDLYYVQNYSIWLDIQILIRTGWIVLRGKGAY